MPRLPLALALFVGAAPLAACSAVRQIDAPSLAPRPIEARPILPPDAASEPQRPTDPAIAARLAIIVEDAEEGHRGFETTRAAAAATIERGARAPAGSEAWVAAQQALSAVEAAKGGVRVAGGELDKLRQEPAAFAAGNRAAIDAAAARLAALADAEDRATAALSKRVS